MGRFYIVHTGTEFHFRNNIVQTGETEKVPFIFKQQKIHLSSAAVVYEKSLHTCRLLESNSPRERSTTGNPEG